jgi:hypothetical protein
MPQVEENMKTDEPKKKKRTSHASSQRLSVISLVSPWDELNEMLDELHVLDNVYVSDDTRDNRRADTPERMRQSNPAVEEQSLKHKAKTQFARSRQEYSILSAELGNPREDRDDKTEDCFRLVRLMTSLTKTLKDIKTKDRLERDGVLALIKEAKGLEDQLHALASLEIAQLSKRNR